MSQANGAGSNGGRNPAKSGFGTGPLLAGALVLAGGLAVTGVAIAHDANTGDGVFAAIQAKASTVQPVLAKTVTEPDVYDGKVTVELDDHDNNGVPDALEKVAEAPRTPSTPAESDPKTTAKGDEDAVAAPKAADTTYLIQAGDTLADISAETGVSVDKLTEANEILNPNLIFAGSALLIPAN